MNNLLIAFMVCTILALGSVLIYYSLRARASAQKLIAKEAFFFHQDLGKKIEEFENDPTITDKEWAMMLEIAKFADQRFLNKCPEKIPEFQSLEEIVAEIIEERRETK